MNHEENFLHKPDPDTPKAYELQASMTEYRRILDALRNDLDEVSAYLQSIAIRIESERNTGSLWEEQGRIVQKLLDMLLDISATSKEFFLPQDRTHTTEIARTLAEIREGLQKTYDTLQALQELEKDWISLKKQIADGIREGEERIAHLKGALAVLAEQLPHN